MGLGRQENGHFGGGTCADPLLLRWCAVREDEGAKYKGLCGGGDAGCRYQFYNHRSVLELATPLRLNKLGVCAQPDGSLRRVRQPVNTIEPHKSLLTPLYQYDIEHATRLRRSVRASVRLPKNVQVADDADNQSRRSVGSHGSQQPSL